MRKKKEILKIKLEKKGNPHLNTGEKRESFCRIFLIRRFLFLEFLRIQAFYIGQLVWAGSIFYFVQVFF